ncbi:DUF2939 domain-containing protein [Microbulbifer magnicolonia]|uniref:DUF2939 domain-containing protein n=1 Tax=Microbulbifer magnicolonia TaxID=3109744 RepID=UPI002B402BA5|nr:DUF2939 domain-containing protein [Microbulbifer sp. GG15]
MKKLLWIALLSLTLLVAGYVALPGYSLEQLEQAAQDASAEQQSVRRQGVETLQHYVDFPVLRDNLKLRLQQRLRESMGDALPAEFDELISAGASLFIGPLLQQLVTPAGIADLLRGGRNLREFERELYRQQGAPAATELREPETSGDSGWQRLRWRFAGIDRVVADYGERGQADLRLILARRGLRWQLVDLELLQGEKRE